MTLAVITDGLTLSRQKIRVSHSRPNQRATNYRLRGSGGYSSQLGDVRHWNYVGASSRAAVGGHQPYSDYRQPHSSIFNRPSGLPFHRRDSMVWLFLPLKMKLPNSITLLIY